MLAVRSRFGAYAATALFTAAALAALVAAQPHANLTTAALALVLVVTVTAILWGSVPALLSALIGLLGLNFFFIPPVRTFSITEPQNWIAFTVFVCTAVAVGQLSSRARKRAAEAEARRIEIERLYRQLTEAIDKASEAETLRKSEKLKTALLDAVTHDLRTPLTSIKASVTTLLGVGTGDAAVTISAEAHRELLDIINEESDRLNQFVEEMMTLAQVEGGQLLLRPAAVTARDVINNALDRMGSRLSSHFVEVTIQDKLPPLQVDAASIAGVVYEVLDNAVKYAPSGSNIHVTARTISSAQAEIAVENEGIPVPAEIRARVFDKFFRGPAPQRDGGRGFGLGLAIARGIVEAHGGRASMEAGPNGRSTVVRFTVPTEVEVAV